jgi:hypothetical protein
MVVIPSKPQWDDVSVKTHFQPIFLSLEYGWQA